MKRIFKYQLEIIGEHVIKIPCLHGYVNRLQEQILKVGTQNNIPCIWVLVDDKNAPTERHVFIKGTGCDCEDVHISDYLGSYQLYDGDFICHVFGY